MRIRYSKQRAEYDVDAGYSLTCSQPDGSARTRTRLLFHWPATRVFDVAELPLDAVLRATEQPGTWQPFKPVESFTVRLAAPIRGLSAAELAAVSSLASGAFSFRDLTGEQFTSIPSEGLIYCATTYESMMRCGWIH